MVADPTTTLQVKNTGSLSVNRYGWINIWMAILGQFFTRFPLFFESCLILLKTWLEIFPDNAGILRIYLLQFSAIVGYKTRRAAEINSTRRFFRVATSSRVEIRVLACGFVLTGGRGGDTK